MQHQLSKFWIPPEPLSLQPFKMENKQQFFTVKPTIDMPITHAIQKDTRSYTQNQFFPREETSLISAQADRFTPAKPAETLASIYDKKTFFAGEQQATNPFPWQKNDSIPTPVKEYQKSRDIDRAPQAVSIHMDNHFNEAGNDIDINGFVRELTSQLKEAISIGTEGLYL